MKTMRRRRKEQQREELKAAGLNVVRHYKTARQTEELLQCALYLMAKDNTSGTEQQLNRVTTLAYSIPARIAVRNNKADD